ncbi:AAA family ATPase [Parapusillimonas granuli]|uniref:AAA family ATPase n=1 Tax=Parapusillimonas granuli TaxID=380911 RepID=A0A853FZA5_9BURK|nr:bifunctional aminoglycoside phosphotransferase/ATP-binding protein [Parapusillimonas granuli]MBB5216988.1 hypothetical protein [Parapusillimonas granuli]MEB2400682.1 AAA family ATPase [Alcaligenaceae bacterium]NYT50248.1 AAA family ATPase [Parapusillimonas granuli]
MAYCPRSVLISNTQAQTEHECLVAALMRQFELRHGAPPVLLRTHASSIILAGDHAYKLKRPVRLPFLDFSTLALRRRFLQLELELNRRTAEALYLDVLPITGSFEQPEVGGSGEAVEWVLRMRRFDPDGGFDVLARQGRLTRAHMESLAAHIADFHLRLPPIPRAEVPAKNAWDWAAESLDEIAGGPNPPRFEAGLGVPELRAALAGAYAGLAPLRERRIAEGWVREGHGDLHLGNIVEWRGRVLAFDALEFDPALRRIDVINDISFTFMDLCANACAPLAWRLMNEYVERTGDYEGLRLLYAYAAAKALVRAKLCLLGQPGAAAFSKYWDLAWSFARPPERRRLILTMGLSGSGKSTVAGLLAERLGAVRIRSDVERKRLAGMAALDRPAAPAELYNQASNARTYDRLSRLAELLLGAGFPVILDAAFLRHDEREAMRRLAEGLGIPFAVVECRAGAPVMLQRVLQRAQAQTDPSDATPQVLKLQESYAEAVPEAWRAFHHIVRNDGSLAELSQELETNCRF